MINKLPENWQSCILSEILYFQNGYAFKSKDFIKSDTIGNLIPLVKQSQLKGSEVNLKDCVFLPADFLDKYKEFIVKKGDILIGLSGSIGKMSFYEYDYPSLLNQRVGKLKLYSEKAFNNKFFGYLLLNLEQNIQDIAKGMGVQNVSSKDIEKMTVNLPPLNEQKRIVDKIETLFSEVDAGIANLTLAKRQLEQYRQSLLKHAFEGKLTAEWRENYAKHTGKSLPTADELLEQIQTARQAHYDQQIKEWEKSIKAWEKEGKNGRKPSKPRKLGEIEILESEGVSQNWIKAYAESVCDFITKGTTPSKENLYQSHGDIPFIKVYNLTKNGNLDFSINPTYTNNEIHNTILSRSKVYPNDILMNIVGPPLGKVSVVPKDYPEWNINQAIVVFRPLSTNIDYFKFFLLSHQTIRLLEEQAKATAGQLNLTLEICRKLPIPICSKEEQALIVSILENKLSVIEKNINEIALQLEKATLLKTSILHQAFQGKLVPQDPNDPPASELLAQIKAEREAQALAEQQAKDAKKKSKSTSKKKAKPKTAKTQSKANSAKTSTASEPTASKQEQITLPL